MKQQKISAKKRDLVPVAAGPASLLPSTKRDSLAAWLGLYMGLEAAAGAENTVKAKQRDLQTFLDYFTEATRSDDPDQWTRSLTGGFLKQLGKEKTKSPTTINRILATLRHCAAWLHR